MSLTVPVIIPLCRCNRSVEITHDLPPFPEPSLVRKLRVVVFQEFRDIESPSICSF